MPELEPVKTESAILSYQRATWSNVGFAFGICSTLVAVLIVNITQIANGSYVMLVLAVGYLGLVPWTYFAMTQRPRGAVRVPIKKAIIELLLAVPLTFALYFVMAWVSYFVYQMGLHSPGDVEIQTQIGQMQSGDLWWPVLFIAFVGPIAEEIVCRGFLLNAIKSRTNWALALVVQAILFAGLHSYSMVGQAMIFVFGLVFGGLYLWRKSLLSSIFVHCLLNGLLVSVAFWNGQLTLDSPFLGVTTEQVDDGVVVVDVAESSPAQSLGLKIGDKITACGENSVRKPEHIVWIVQSHPLDEDFPIWLTRDGKELYFEAKLMTRRQYQQLVSQPK